MIAYKLFKLRKDGSLGPLFINCRQRLEVGQTYMAENHPTKGYKVRPGWHCCKAPSAPHLSTKGRVWAKVRITDYEKHLRPPGQGGLWFTANRLTILSVL